MSRARHTILGKAFEYACAIALRDALCATQEVEMADSPQLQSAERYFNDELTEKERTRISNAARAGVRVLLRFEPQLSHPGDNQPLIIALAADTRGQEGDVRDVLFIRRQNEWEIGISCKHNHMAVKHSRLSASIDFGQKWFGIPCSEQYFSEVEPIFGELERIKNQSNGTAKWSALGGNGAKTEIYRKVLTAFADELQRLENLNPGQVAPKLISYLIGGHDFYKVIAIDKEKSTEVQAFNIYGTLNAAAGDKKSFTDIKRIKLPSRFHRVEFYKDDKGVEKPNTLAVYCDRGWEVSLRIHNASSRVEPSLKFDVQLLTYPREIRNQIELWDSNE